MINRLLGLMGGLFNDFDGKIELLDDLEDHWAAAVHKKERNDLIRRLQAFAKEKKVRVTILSGDVHLAAVGRFFTRVKDKIPQEKDHRYMVNVVSCFALAVYGWLGCILRSMFCCFSFQISSAITNAPPPEGEFSLCVHAEDFLLLTLGVGFI